MYLSYLDESGSPGDPNTPFFVLGGVAIFERQTHWVDRELDAIADRYQQQVGQYLELHANPMRSGKDGWEKLAVAERTQASADVIRVLRRNRLKIFAAVVEQNQFLSAADVLPYCYEAIASRFDDYLAHQYQRHNNPQRGIFVLDRRRAQEERDMQVLHQTFRLVGHANGRLRNFAEVPMFADSRSTRLIQLADSIAYWIYRRYTARDDWGWRELQTQFASLGNGRRGLHEVLAPATPAALQPMPTSPWPFPAALPAVPDGGATAAAGAAPAAVNAASPRLAPGAVVTV